jgi:hypothetical protein
MSIAEHRPRFKKERKKKASGFNWVMTTREMTGKS